MVGNHSKEKQDKEFESVLLSFEGLIYWSTTILPSIINTKCNYEHCYCGCQKLAASFLHEKTGVDSTLESELRSNSSILVIVLGDP